MKDVEKQIQKEIHEWKRTATEQVIQSYYAPSETELERQRIAKFLRDVFEMSTHGASDLMWRAISAVEQNNLDDPVAVAQPHIPS